MNKHTEGVNSWFELTPPINLEVEVELYSGKVGIGWYTGDWWNATINGQLLVDVRVRAWRYHD